MLADDQFLELCPDAVSIKQWCLSPPTNGTCCGVCPNTLSGLGGHVSLAFSSLSSLAAIALSPASAPSALVTNLIQADAYAVALLGWLLSDSSGLDFFHAAYALLLAFSSLIPLTAIAASPPWAVTGQKSPYERSQEAEQTVLSVLQEMDEGSASSDDDEKRGLRRRRRHRQKLRRILEDNPTILLSDGPRPPCCGIPGSHWMLYLGFTVSILLWGAALYLGILGGVTGKTKVALSQPNCTEDLGPAAVYILYANIGFMFLAIVVYIATIINHLMHDVATALDREVTTEYSGSTRLVFGVSFVVWLVWMASSFTIYFMAGRTRLLAAGEWGWSFGNCFSALMLIVPVYSVIKALWANR
ncbi:hypothetical protein JCM6882_007451 [Rhodosporidiobolus microsporus]